MADRSYPAPSGSYGRAFAAGRPTAIIIHSLEAPATKGMAWSLLTGWLQNAGVSVHAITDPGESCDEVGLGTIAYHCGGGNPYSLGNEHTGYAAWTFEQWTSEPAFSALRLGAQKVAKQAKALGWKAADLRWLSIAQLKAGERGLATHNDARLAFGGTTHTDPGPGFPYAIYLQMVQQWFGAPVKSAPTPNPTDTGPGGAETDWLEMATKDEVATVVAEQIKKLSLPTARIVSFADEKGDVNAYGLDGPTGVVKFDNWDEKAACEAVLTGYANQWQYDVYNAVVKRGAAAKVSV